MKAPWGERIILTLAGAAAGAALTVLLLPRNPAKSVPPPGALPQHTAARAPAAPAAAGPPAGPTVELPAAADGVRLKQLEQLDKEANDRLIEAQNRLAEGRKRIFEKDFALRQAFETWKVNDQKRVNLSNPPDWWNIQKDPKTREAMGKTARMLMVREMAATIQDPEGVTG